MTSTLRDSVDPMASTTNPAGFAVGVEPRLREILGGAAAFRVLTIAWAIAVTVVDSRSGVLTHRLFAFAMLAAVATWTGFIGLSAQSQPQRLVRPLVVAVDVALAATVMVTDTIVYRGTHPQSFGSAWPAVAVVSTGAIGGQRSGLATGAGIGAVNIVAAAIAGRLEGRVLSLSGTLVLLAMTGAVAGYVSTRLRQADSAIADARARDQFARTLHDGVLQTLAVIQRRSDDGSLVELAREQEWELRDFISHGTTESDDLLSIVRRAAARAERHHGVRVNVVVIAEPDQPSDATAALAGATAEAITNAAKHAQASTITVCVDRPDQGCTVTVNDDGHGFDVDTTTPGTGLSSSIHARIDEVDGTVSIRSRPDHGTEVTLWVP